MLQTEMDQNRSEWTTECAGIQIEIVLSQFYFGRITEMKNSSHSDQNETKLTTMHSTVNTHNPPNPFKWVGLETNFIHTPI